MSTPSIGDKVRGPNLKGIVRGSNDRVVFCSVKEWIKALDGHWVQATYDMAVPRVFFSWIDNGWHVDLDTKR